MLTNFYYDMCARHDVIIESAFSWLGDVNPILFNLMDAHRVQIKLPDTVAAGADHWQGGKAWQTEMHERDFKPAKL